MTHGQNHESNSVCLKTMFPVMLPISRVKEIAQYANENKKVQRD